MFEDRIERTTKIWLAAGGVAAGIAAGYLLSRRARGRRTLRELTTERGLVRLEEQVVDRLKRDPDLAHRDIEVAALTEGIIELTGRVYTDEEADRAIQRAQDLPEVRTVLNRLDTQELEEHLEETRERYERGDADLHETHHYGMRVGTGSRRQGDETEPDRPDEKVRSVTRQLGVNRAEVAPGEDVEKVGPAVEGHTTGPAGPTYSGTAEDVPNPEAPGEELEETPQDFNTGARVHENVKPGTEATLEEAGLEGELEKRDREGES